MKHYTVITYGCKEWLCRTGRIPGELVYYSPRPRLTMADVKAAVVARFYLQAGDMVSARKSYDISHPRQLSMYLCKQLTPKSLPDIGKAHGDRDHTTVIHAIKQVEKRRAADPEYDYIAAELERQLARPREMAR